VGNSQPRPKSKDSLRQKKTGINFQKRNQKSFFFETFVMLKRQTFFFKKDSLLHISPILPDFASKIKTVMLSCQFEEEIQY
jgi:hypothetical protein